jgi:transposase
MPTKPNERKRLSGLSWLNRTWLEEQDVWERVRQDAEEHATWKRRCWRRQVVARRYERARWKREDFAHQKSRRIINEFDLIAIEDLSLTLHTG